MPANAWPREGVRRAGEVFTILGAGRFVLHEGHHHLLDVGRSLRTAGAGERWIGRQRPQSSFIPSRTGAAARPTF